MSMPRKLELVVRRRKRTIREMWDWELGLVLEMLRRGELVDGVDATEAEIVVELGRREWLVIPPPINRGWVVVRWWEAERPYSYSS